MRSRRLPVRIRLAMATSLAGLLLAACGDDGGQTAEPVETTGDEATSDEAVSDEAASDEVIGLGDRRTFEHVFGTAEIPVDPERVVAVDPVTFGILEAVGVRPVGAALGNVSGIAHLETATDGVADIGGIGAAGELNLEAIAALDPDVIITFGTDWNEETYDRLEPIAPTVAPPYDYVTLDQTMEHWLGVADAAGALEGGEGVVAELNERIEELRQRFETPMADKPVSVLRVGTDGFYSVRFGSMESSLLRAIGIPRPENQRNPEDFAFDLSLERVEEVDAYAIFVYVDRDAEDEFAALAANPLWERLEAVQAGRVFPVEASVWNGLDPIAADLVLDDIERHLGGALDM